MCADRNDSVHIDQFATALPVATATCSSCQAALISSCCCNSETSRSHGTLRGPKGQRLSLRLQNRLMIYLTCVHPRKMSQGTADLLQIGTCEKFEMSVAQLLKSYVDAASCREGPFLPEQGIHHAYLAARDRADCPPLLQTESIPKFFHRHNTCVLHISVPWTVLVC